MASPSNVPVNIPFVWEYPRKFQRVWLSGMVKVKEKALFAEAKQYLVLLDNKSVQAVIEFALRGKE